MFTKSKIAAVALVAMMGLAAPALARDPGPAHHRAHTARQLYNYVPPAPGGEFDPALNGGGSAGYNQLEKEEGQEW